MVSRGSTVARRGVRRSMLTCGRDIAHLQKRHERERHARERHERQRRAKVHGLGSRSEGNKRSRASSLEMGMWREMRRSATGVFSNWFLGHLGFASLFT